LIVLDNLTYEPKPPHNANGAAPWAAPLASR
jgi:hypothetical protein